MQSFDEKVDSAVHVAFTALGLSVGNNMELACRLNDFITQEFQFTVSDDGDDDDQPAIEADTPSAAARGAGGHGDD